MKDKIFYELNFCLEHREKQGYCTFGGKTQCKQCGVPYLMRKLLTGEIIHGSMKRLTLEDRKQKVKKYSKTN